MLRWVLARTRSVRSEVRSEVQSEVRSKMQPEVRSEDTIICMLYRYLASSTGNAKLMYSFCF